MFNSSPSSIQKVSVNVIFCTALVRMEFTMPKDFLFISFRFKRQQKGGSMRDWSEFFEECVGALYYIIYTVMLESLWNFLHFCISTQ